ncbi:hypothetical protein [Rhizobium sp. No.120]
MSLDTAASAEFIKNAVLESYFSLNLTELSFTERQLISDKIDLVASSIAGVDGLLDEIVDRTRTRPLRSKLLTLILGFRHKAIILGLGNINRRLSVASRTPALPISLVQARDAVIRADRLIQDIISQSKLSFH